MTTEGAIREDVQQAAVQPKKGEEGYQPSEDEVRENPRMKMMELMGGRRTEDVVTEAAGEVTPTHAKPLGIPGGDDDRSQVDQQLQEQHDPGRPAATTTPTIRVKVDGKEADVPLTEVVAGYQKNTAADARLEQASKMLREATERAEQLAAQLNNAGARSAGAAPNTDPQPGEATEDLRVAAKQVLSSLYEGDEDKAADKLATLLAQGRASALSPEELARQVAPLVVPEVQQQAAKNSALTSLQTDYPMLFDDPDYASVANAHVGRLLASGKTQAEAIQEAGTYVVGKFGLKKQGAQAGRGSTSVDVDSAGRLERKQASDPVPGLGVSSATSMQDAPASTSSVIEEMKKARGQAA